MASDGLERGQTHHVGAVFRGSACSARSGFIARRDSIREWPPTLRWKEPSHRRFASDEPCNQDVSRGAEGGGGITATALPSFTT